MPEQIFTVLYDKDFVDRAGTPLRGSVINSRRSLESARKLVAETAATSGRNQTLTNEKLLNGHMHMLQYEAEHTAPGGEDYTQKYVFVIVPNTLDK